MPEPLRVLPKVYYFFLGSACIEARRFIVVTQVLLRARTRLRHKQTGERQRDGSLFPLEGGVSSCVEQQSMSDVLI